MSSNAVLDVAIGLILMYLILSLICTTINEMLASFLGLRATTLRAGIQRLLDDGAVRNAFYDHGLIAGTGQAAGDDGNHPSYISGSTFALALLGSVDPTKPIPVFQDVQESVKHLPDSNVRDMLLAQIMQAEGDLDKLRRGVATYFDEAMDRVSGIYKGHLKIISLSVALVLALACNADSIVVARALWADGALRAQLVKSAEGMSQAADATKDSDAHKLRQWQDQLRPLPLGWGNQPTPTADDYAVLHWFARVFGLLLTTLAVSLGAPFWFDVLSKFVSVRSTGKPPSRTTQTV